MFLETRTYLADRCAIIRIEYTCLDCRWETRTSTCRRTSTLAAARWGFDCNMSRRKPEHMTAPGKVGKAVTESVPRNRLPAACRDIPVAHSGSWRCQGSSQGSFALVYTAGGNCAQDKTRLTVVHAPSRVRAKDSRVTCGSSADIPYRGCMHVRHSHCLESGRRSSSLPQLCIVAGWSRVLT